MAQDAPQDGKQVVLDLIDDAVINLLYYDRKEDDDLSSECIYALFQANMITIDEATAYFRAALTEYLEGELR